MTKQIQGHPKYQVNVLYLIKGYNKEENYINNAFLVPALSVSVYFSFKISCPLTFLNAQIIYPKKINSCG